MTENKNFPYDMGNAGDFIKHGALTLFVQWWCENNPTKTLRFADPFGGIPCGRVINPVIKKRLNILRGEEPFVAECLWDGDTYRNSGHIVAEAVRQCGKKPEVWTSDKCPDRCEQLKESGLNMLHKKYDGYQCDDGYSILAHAGDFDLVLLDPCGDLLKKNIRQFQKIHKAACDNPKTAIMVFVLDMQGYGMLPETSGIEDKHNRYLKERKELGDMAFSLRCRKVRGESKYEPEVILISQAFANDGGRKLYARLEQFKSAAQKALATDIIMWGG